MTRISRLWTERKTSVIAVLLLATGVLFGAVRYSSRSPSVPLFVVKRGDFIDSLQFRGEVKALKSVTIVAPAEAGDFQILKIAADGAPVKQGDVVVRVRQDPDGAGPGAEQIGIEILAS